MPRMFNPFHRRRRPPRPPGPREDASGPSAMAGDPALSLPGTLALGTAFAFDAAFAARLKRRALNEKEAFTVRDAAGAWFRASLKELGAAGGSALPYEACADPEPRLALTLACAVLGRQRMLVVMQKATELGAARVVPLLTEHSVPAAGLAHEKAHAWPGQVLRAAKQCRRSSLPEVAAPMALDAFLASEAAQADLTLFLDDRVGAATPTASPRSAVLLVGPEGGFSDAERARLAGRAAPWRLGARVLRAETAVFAGLTAVQTLWGDFRT